MNNQLVPVMLKERHDLPDGYPELWAPTYEDNMRGVLHVCICNGCEDSKPRIFDLAHDFKLSVYYEDENGKMIPINKLFTK